jgi:hypothetical protein
LCGKARQGEIVIRRLAVPVALAILAGWLQSASADVVELRGGDRVEGSLKEATPTGVVIEVAGQSIRFDVAKVRAIYFGVAGSPPAPQDVPPPPGPPLSPPSPASPAAGALQLMQSLRSTVAAGTTLREYETRLNGTAPFVELYLAGLPPAAAEALRDAIRYYLLAEWAWSNQGIATRTVWLRRDDVLERCPAYQEFASAMRAKGEAYYAERTRSYLVIADGAVPVLWSCASDKITEAETLLPKAAPPAAAQK